MSDTKNAKVAAIINDYSLIINAGENQGIQNGDNLMVIDQERSTITDPVTGEVIGEFPIPKIKLSVTQTHPNFSVCETIKQLDTVHIATKALYSSVNSLSNRNTFIFEGKPLIDNDTLFNKPIKVGDSVVFID